MPASNPNSPFWLDALHHAAEQFNSKQFWECHETLEAVWLTAPEPDKTFLQGLIQVAAGCHHVKNKNIKGAQALLKRGLEKLCSVKEISVFENDFMGAVEKLQHSMLSTDFPVLKINC